MKRFPDLYQRQRGFFARVYESGSPTPWPSTEPTPSASRLAQLLKRRKGSRRILDLGCGEGRHTLLFAQAGFFTVGLDYLAAPLRTVAQRAQAKRLTPRIRLLLGDALMPPFKPGYFDVVVDSGVFHHLKKADWPIYVDRVLGLVKPGGYIHLTVFSTKFKHYPGERRTRNWCIHRNHYDHFFAKRDFTGIFGRWCEILAIEEEHEGLNGFFHVLMRKLPGHVRLTRQGQPC
ncbi:SAM dependent methyltransferase [Candidatus Methylomirabilis lanthanidiphila]|uniref:SAM dependent methyltransferase n=1 Tax=Candidatus Methylomirabilis lanthanidiphila TaxID=2211376 RepID=A0A564ZG39_9BACT|nr:class I SAM-dependent methyltransferase [Candidatus Methylomirabilis lanthanidiphila]VUZ84311.1 SAM dependent methyltransferase [Candidatus Methylomirabilis lanthanidiphila]